MKYVLVDKYDNVVTTKELESLWRVITEERYHEISESFLRRPSSEGEFGDWLDYEKS